MNISFSTDTEELTDVMLDTLIAEPSQLIVYNDDYNTFDWVIQSFIEVCGHNSQQAEQLSLIIHFKGKATVMTDSFEILKPIRHELIQRGLSAVIESVSQEH